MSEPKQYYTYILESAEGCLFIANPDLPERFRRGATLNEPKPETFYGTGPFGYTDYPALTWSHRGGKTRGNFCTKYA